LKLPGLRQVRDREATLIFTMLLNRQSTNSKYQLQLRKREIAEQYDTKDFLNHAGVCQWRYIFI